MRQVIKEIRALDLLKYPTDEVKELLLKFGKVPYLLTEYNYPKIIHRACPELFDDLHWCQIKYEAQHLE